MNDHIPVNNLSQFPLLNVFSEDTLLEISKMIREKTLQKQEILFLEGQSALDLFFVISGWLKAEKVSHEGRQQTLRFIGPGEVINELAVFSHEANEMTVIAMEDARVFSLAQPVVDNLLLENPNFSRAIIENLAQRIKSLLKHVENLSLYPVEVRLARLLLEESHNGVYERHPWKTQAEIANQLGTVLDVVNRNLNNLVNQGMIEIDRDQIKVIDEARLKQIAKG
jgi:CRP/FNR family transcriptional regulator